MAEPSIRRLDPTDEADMDAFQEVYVAAELDEDPRAALYSRADGISILTSTGGWFGEGYGAFAGDRMVGELLLTGSRVDNLQVVRVWIWVTPARQRRGVGSLLASYADRRVRELGRSICQAQARIGTDRDNKNIRFARSVGYDLANTEIERRLPLPADRAGLARLATEAAAYHRGYEIRTVVGPVPDELAASYVSLKNLLAVEAPAGDLELEAGEETVAELRVQDEQLAATGRTRVGAYAVDAAGEVAGYSVAATSADGSPHVDQWGTLVRPADRGHRLGMATKCALLAVLGDAFPDKRFVETTNAESNTHMVAINEALGFRIAHVHGDFQRRLR